MIRTLNKENAKFLSQIKDMYKKVLPTLHDYFSKEVIEYDLASKNNDFFNAIIEKGIIRENIEEEIKNSNLSKRSIHFFTEEDCVVSLIESEFKKEMIYSDEFKMRGTVYINWFLANPVGKGYGSILLENFLWNIKNNDSIDAISLTVHKSSPAISLYKRLGFQSESNNRLVNVKKYSILIADSYLNVK